LAAGPQFYLRKWEKVTFFGPSRFRAGSTEAADINLDAGDAVLEELGIPVPSAHQTDTRQLSLAGAAVSTYFFFFLKKKLKKKKKKKKNFFFLFFF